MLELNIGEFLCSSEIFASLVLGNISLQQSRRIDARVLRLYRLLPQDLDQSIIHYIINQFAKSLVC